MVSRADLVRLAAEMGTAAIEAGELARMAPSMGFEREPPSLPPEPPPSPPELFEPPPTSTGAPVSVRAPSRPVTVEERTRSIAFLRLEEAHFKDAEELAPSPSEAEMVLRPEDWNPPGRSLFSPLKMPSLAPWRRLWPRLRERLQIVRSGRDLDMRAITRALGRGQVLTHLPRLPRSAWTPRLTLWRDHSHRLAPWAADPSAVQRALVRVCGKAAVQVRYLDDRHAGSPETDSRGRLVRIDPDSPILVLGDLGAYGSEHHREAWLRAAKRLRNGGARLFALVAASRERTGADTFAEWNAIAWERAGLRPTPGFPEDILPRREDLKREQPRPQGEKQEAEQGREQDRQRQHQLQEQKRLRDQRTEELLMLTAAAVVVQPGLLRVLRRLLPASKADFSTEVAAWSHPDVEAAGTSGLVLKKEARERYRARLACQSSELLLQVRDAIHDWHARLPPEIVHAETIAWSAHIEKGPCSRAERPVPPLGDRKAASEFVQRLANSADAGDSKAGLSREDLRRACVTFRSLVPEDPEKYEDPRVQKALERMRQIAEYKWKDLAPPKACVVSIVGRSLVLRPAPASGAWPAHAATKDPGSPLSWLPATRGGLRVLRSRGAESVEERPDIAAGLRIDVKEGEELVLETDQCRLVYRSWSPERWVSGAGMDRFGLWADLEVQGVVQRFRWIPPGRFWMGSPKGEAGRWDDEGPQHQVTFTRGYWVADTPCTQALWEAVMGSNPSRFKSPDRPVERVSWNDCQTFLARLEELVPDLAPRLPGEAEWEHACRAGTSTATWLGDLEIQGERNAPLLNKIAWYAGNCGVDFDLKEGVDTSDWPQKQFEHTEGGTRRVRQKDPSPWGLYDMIGNVLEWCADAYSAYQPHDVPDLEPLQGGEIRVFRGGSWLSNARRCRAAYRNWRDPGNAFDDLGFRLVRGRAPRKGAEPQEGARSVPDQRDAGRGPFEATLRDATEPPTKISKLSAAPPVPSSDRRR